MDRLEAYERRAWRLAALLTGDEAAAEAVVRRCLRAQSNIGALPSARLDRLVIQASRELEHEPAPDKSGRIAQMLEAIRRSHRKTRGGPIARADGPVPAASLFSAEAQLALHILRRLPEQQREAWILRALDGVEPIEASKAMDCSRTALQRHLELAEATMARALGEREAEVIAALKRDAEALNPEAFIERRVRHRRCRKLLRRNVMITAAIVAVIAVVWLLWRYTEGLTG